MFLKGMSKSFYMVKFNVSILNRLKIMGFYAKYLEKRNVNFHKTVTKLVAILTKYFFPYLNPTSYLYFGRDFTHFFGISIVKIVDNVGLLFRGQLVKKYV